VLGAACRQWRNGSRLLGSSCQIAVKDGEVLYKGKCGAEFTVEEGYKAAQQCAINIIAHVRDACDGDLTKVKKVVRLGGFVACTPDFYDHPKVVNGASDLIGTAFGDVGRHSRAAVGVPSLPLNSAVEVEAVVEVDF